MTIRDDLNQELEELSDKNKIPINKLKNEYEVN